MAWLRTRYGMEFYLIFAHTNKRGQRTMRILRLAFLSSFLAFVCMVHAQADSNPDDASGSGGGGTQTPSSVTLSNVTATPQWPWNGLVDVQYTVTCPGFNPATMAIFIELSGYDMVTKQEYRLLKAVDGDGIVRSLPDSGTFRALWDARQEFGKNSNYNSSDFKVGVQAILKDKPALPTDGDYEYMIVHLAADGDIVEGDITYSNEGPNLEDDACRSTQLWLRRIHAGTFTMGEPGSTSAATRPHQVTITKDYFIGVFELTYKQWELITGAPLDVTANISKLKGDLRPVGDVSYHDVRGNYYGEIWPRKDMVVSNPNHVDPRSFMGVLRSLTKATFDLPTEAEWEYACRAGTTTDLNNGTNFPNDGDHTVFMKNANIGRFEGNEKDDIGGYSEGTTTVGSFEPNQWGLYDMHGNIEELCLDRYSDYPNTAVTDPDGGYDPTLGNDQDIHCVTRGGNYEDSPNKCTSWARKHPTQSGSLGIGFRVCWRP